jgi:hypothetical protein
MCSISIKVPSVLNAEGGEYNYTGKGSVTNIIKEPKLTI